MRAAAALAPPLTPPAAAWRPGRAGDAAEGEAERVAAHVLAGLPHAPARRHAPGVLRRQEGGGARGITLPSTGDIEAEAGEALVAALGLVAEGEAIAAAELARIEALVDQALAALAAEAGRAAAAAGAAVRAAVYGVAMAMLTAAAAGAVLAAGLFFSALRAIEAMVARIAALPEDLAALAAEARRRATAGAAMLGDWADTLAAAAGLREAPAESRRAAADRAAEAERRAEEAGVLPPIGSVCGPDVTAATASVWARVRSDFAGWTDQQKCDACGRLVNPIIAGASSPSLEAVTQGLEHLWETGNVVEGGQGVLIGLGLDLNRDAFDTLGLYLGSASYLRDPPYSPPCGQPPSPNPAAPVTDHVHEDPATCATTVQIGHDCWVSGTANYGTYGIMTRACSDWLSGGGACPLPAQLFSRTATIALVQAYKRLDRDDPEPPTRWALATYDGGATAYASGGNRPNCPTTCAVPYGGGPFAYVWEPVVPRVGWAP